MTVHVQCRTCRSSGLLLVILDRGRQDFYMMDMKQIQGPFFCAHHVGLSFCYRRGNFDDFLLRSFLVILRCTCCTAARFLSCDGNYVTRYLHGQLHRVSYQQQSMSQTHNVKIRSRQVIGRGWIFLLRLLRLADFS